MSWKKSVKRAMAPIAAAFPRRVQGTPGVVLCYHGVGLRAAPEMVAVDMFRRQLDLLLDRFRVVSVSEMIASIDGPSSDDRLQVALTFDDGYVNVLERALPALLERGVSATAYVLPGLWGTVAQWPSEAPAEERTLWSEADAKTWEAAGMTLGSHGSTHVDLSAAPDEVIESEVRGSRQELDGPFGPIESFCYPWGRSSAVARQRVEAAGYLYAVAGGYSRHHTSDAIFEVGRITVDHDDDVHDLLMKLRGGYDWLDGAGRLREKVGAWRPS